MDTRTKIVEWPQVELLIRERLAKSTAQKVVTGYFDPLLVTHVTRLAEISDQTGRLVIVVTEPERPILAARARAELIAALADVELVAVAAAGAEEFLSSLPDDILFREESADRGRAGDFAAQVQRRQAAG